LPLFFAHFNASRALSLPHFQYALFHRALSTIRPHNAPFSQFAHTFAPFTMRPQFSAFSHCASYNSRPFIAPHTFLRLSHAPFSMRPTFGWPAHSSPHSLAHIISFSMLTF
jgi:hypothetical protein